MSVARTRDRAVIVVVRERVEIDCGEFEIARRRISDRIQLAVLQEHPAARRAGLDVGMANGFHFEGCGIARTVHGSS